MLVAHSFEVRKSVHTIRMKARLVSVDAPDQFAALQNSQTLDISILALHDVLGGPTVCIVGIGCGIPGSISSRTDLRNELFKILYSQSSR